jgi:hypothetical protein
VGLSVFIASTPTVHQAAILLLSVGVAAFVYASSESWWPPLRRHLGIPDPVPTLEFLWPEDSGQRLIVNRESWDVVVTVRNPSTTQTLTSVRVTLEWWMRESAYRAGAYPLPNDRVLQLQFEQRFECTLAPLDRARFRLCSMIGDDENHSLLIAPRDDGQHFNAGAGKFVFNVRASADNALRAWDFYVIEATSYGLYSTHRDPTEANRAYE